MTRHGTFESLIRSALDSLDVAKDIAGADGLSNALRRLAWSRAKDCDRQARKLSNPGVLS